AAAAQEFVAGFEVERIAAALGVDLHDAVIFAGGGDHGRAFDDVDAERFFQVEIGAGFHGGDGGQRVPVIGGGDDDDVGGAGGEHLTVIGERARDGLLVLSDELQRFVQV